MCLVLSSDPEGATCPKSFDHQLNETDIIFVDVARLHKSALPLVLKAPEISLNVLNVALKVFAQNFLIRSHRLRITW